MLPSVMIVMTMMTTTTIMMMVVMWNEQMHCAYCSTGTALVQETELQGVSPEEGQDAEDAVAQPAQLVSTVLAAQGC